MDEFRKVVDESFLYTVLELEELGCLLTRGILRKRTN